MLADVKESIEARVQKSEELHRTDHQLLTMQVKEKVHLEEVQKVLTDFQTQVSEQLQTLYDDVGKQLKETKMKQDLDQTRESAEEVREMIEKLRHEDSKFG